MKLGDYWFDPPHAVGKLRPMDLRHDLLRRNPVSFHNDWLFADWLDAVSDQYAELRRAYKRGSAGGVSRSGGVTPGDLQYFVHTRLWQMLQGKQYAFNKTFLEELIGSDLDDAPENLLPAEFSGYLSFPRGVVKYRDLTIAGAYLSIARPPRIPLVKGNNRWLWLTALSDIDIRDGKYGLVSNYIEVKDGMPIKTTVNDRHKLILHGENTPTEEMDKLVRLAVVCALYINSGNPDIRHLKPMGPLSKSAIQGLRNKGIDPEDEYSEDVSGPTEAVGFSWQDLGDVESVSWGWKKPDEYTAEKWKVRGYFKGVRYGEGRAQIRPHWFPPSIRRRDSEKLNGVPENVHE